MFCSAQALYTPLICSKRLQWWSRTKTTGSWLQPASTPDRRWVRRPASFCTFGTVCQWFSVWIRSASFAPLPKQSCGCGSSFSSFFVFSFPTAPYRSLSYRLSLKFRRLGPRPLIRCRQITDWGAWAELLGIGYSRSKSCWPLWGHPKSKSFLICWILQKLRETSPGRQESSLTFHSCLWIFRTLTPPAAKASHPRMRLWFCRWCPKESCWRQEAAAQFLAWAHWTLDLTNFLDPVEGLMMSRFKMTL